MVLSALGFRLGASGLGFKVSGSGICFGYLAQHGVQCLGPCRNMADKQVEHGKI